MNYINYFNSTFITFISGLSPFFVSLQNFKTIFDISSCSLVDSTENFGFYIIICGFVVIITIGYLITTSRIA